MSINYWTEKINPVVEQSSLQGKPRTEDDILPNIAPRVRYHLLVQGKLYWRIIAIVLIAFLFLGLWQLKTQASNKTPLKIINMAQMGNNGVEDQSQTVIASKNCHSFKKWHKILLSMVWSN